MNNFTKVVSDLRHAFQSGKTRSYEWRYQQLQQLLKLLNEQSKEIEDAVYKDLHKHRIEAIVFEISLVKNDIVNAMNNLKKWMEPEKTKKDLLTVMDTCIIQSQPFGVTLIIGAWNYPLQLTLLPLVGALAAGNCSIIKPSELASNTAKFLAKAIPDYLDKECVQVINGAVEETTALLNERFDLIFYTGNSVVGKIVMEAAAKNLTPVILELGGKSPVYVDKGINLDTVARRIMWGKTCNSGQTCIAPDYVMCPRDVQEPLIESIKKVLKEFFDGDAYSSPCYGRIINERHFQRIRGLLKSANVAIGGDVNENEKFIAPTVLRDVKPSDNVMQSEIFGPVLPIMPVVNEDQAIDYINNGEKPLAMYIFSNTKSVVDKFLNQTSSGGVTVNDTILHAGVPSLPFGGVGNSGTGSYHGKFSFDAFSHKRAVLKRGLGMEWLNSVRYPPYTERNLGIIKFLTGKKPKKTGIFSFLPFVLLGTVLAVFLKVTGVEAIASKIRPLMGKKGMD